MEGLTRLVSESLARYGLDRPVDYRRLQWSRWFRCESLHSLLHVPSKPGIFALAEEVISSSSADERDWEGHDFSSEPALSKRSASKGAESDASAAASAAEGRRMLSVLQFHEDDDMAYVLDRMLSRPNPMSRTLAAGRCFVRFVVIEDSIQRRSICNALNQWLVSTAETVTGIGAHLATSQDFVARAHSPATASAATLNSGFATNIHCPHPLPSGF